MLQFFNECLHKSKILNEESKDTDVMKALEAINSFFLNCLETLDLLYFFLTRSFQNEIFTKILYAQLQLSDGCIYTIEIPLIILLNFHNGSWNLLE